MQSIIGGLFLGWRNENKSGRIDYKIIIALIC